MFTTSSRKKSLAATVLAALLLVSGAAVAEQSTVYFENWENGMGTWSASNGVWEVGATSGGCEVYQGLSVAGTNLDGSYPRYANTRLESPEIQLPEDPLDGKIWLRYWNWISLNYEGDWARVEVSVDGGAWIERGRTIYKYGSRWAPCILDLSEFAGSSIRIGFRMVDYVPSGPDESWGWYLDEVEILEGAFNWLSLETFDSESQYPEYGGWYADRGIWQIGCPTLGPASAASGKYCAGTVLDANYPRYADSRLISPEFLVPANPLEDQVWLSFMDYRAMDMEGDYCRVEVLVDGAWEELSRDYDRYSYQWTEHILDLSPYLGKVIRLGFRIIDNVPSGPDESYGWFIDDVAIVTGPQVFNNPDNFEGGSRGWAANNGVWELGVPTSGPGAAHSGQYCWGTNLSGNYPRYTSSELLTSWFDIPEVPTEQIILRFMEYHDYNSEGDYGTLRIHTADGAVADLSANFTGTSAGWTQYVSEDIGSSYAGQRVRIGFRHYDYVPSGPDEDPGWYIDDFEVMGLPQSSPQTWPDVGTSIPQVTRSQGPTVVDWLYLPWDPQYVAVYASRSEDFIPNLGNRIALVGDDATSYLDADRPGWGYFYQVTLIDDLGHESLPGTIYMPHSGVTGQGSLLPGPRADLQSVYPNPFNPSTVISFKLNSAAMVTLEVYDVAGRKVATLLDNQGMGEGVHDVPFRPQGLSSGLYLCRLDAGGDVQTRKMMLTK